MTDMRTNALPIVIESVTEEERDVDFLPKDTVFEDHNCRAFRGGAGMFGVQSTGKESCTASGNAVKTMHFVSFGVKGVFSWKH